MSKELTHHTKHQLMSPSRHKSFPTTYNRHLERRNLPLPTPWHLHLRTPLALISLIILLLTSILNCSIPPAFPPNSQLLLPQIVDARITRTPATLAQSRRRRGIVVVTLCGTEELLCTGVGETVATLLEGGDVLGGCRGVRGAFFFFLLLGAIEYYVCDVGL